MDSLVDMWYITTNHTEILELIRLRSIQLGEQRQIDKELSDRCQECPADIQRLLMLERQWNRNSTEQLQDSPSIKEYVKSIRDNYDKISKHQEQLNDIFHRGFLPGITHCENLRYYLEQIE